MPVPRVWDVHFWRAITGSCSWPTLLLQVPQNGQNLSLPQASTDLTTSTKSVLVALAHIYNSWYTLDQSWADLAQLPSLPLICCMILSEWLPLLICLWHSQNINIHVKNLIYKMTNSIQRGSDSALSYKRLVALCPNVGVSQRPVSYLSSCFDREQHRHMVRSHQTSKSTVGSVWPLSVMMSSTLFRLNLITTWRVLEFSILNWWEVKSYPKATLDKGKPQANDQNSFRQSLWEQKY